MENATKALLIAAAVLIAIVLIALGVNLLSAGGDTAGQAEQVGTSLNEGITDAKDKVTDALGSLGGGSTDVKIAKGGRISNVEDLTSFLNAIGASTSITGLTNALNNGREIRAYDVTNKTVPTVWDEEIWANSGSPSNYAKYKLAGSIKSPEKNAQGTEARSIIFIEK